MLPRVSDTGTAQAGTSGSPSSSIVEKSSQILYNGIDRGRSIGGENDEPTVSVMDEKLQPTIQGLLQLPPPSQELVIGLVRQLCEQEGIIVPLTTSTGLQSPIEGLGLWEANMIMLNRSPGTIRGYKYLIIAYLKIDPIPTALSIKAELARKVQEEGLTAQGVTNYINALRCYFACLKSEGLWIQNPAAKIEKPKIIKRERQIPTEEEMGKLLAILAKVNNPKFTAWIIVMLTTGLRRDELARLTWDKVNFKGLKLQVMGKGRKERTVPMQPITAQVLMALRKTQPWDEQQVIATKDKSGAWDPKASNRMLARLCRLAGIRRLSAHALRHFFATYTRKHGAKLEVVSKILGHASIGITADIYEHFDEDEIADEHRRFAPLSQPLLEEGKESP